MRDHMNQSIVSRKIWDREEQIRLQRVRSVIKILRHNRVECFLS